MRSLGSLCFSTVVLSTLLVPAVGMAAQPHSWCVPGAGLYSWLVPPENKTFDTVVRYVCIPTSQKGAGFGNCCNETFTLL
jgi:hypothetical protein